MQEQQADHQVVDETSELVLEVLEAISCGVGAFFNPVTSPPARSRSVLDVLIELAHQRSQLVELLRILVGG